MPISPEDQQEFSDADFRVVATADQSKKLKFDVSGITTATTRTWTAPDASGTVALTSDLAAYQPLDSDLTSWAAITRASGFDAFAAAPSSANLKSAVTDETGSGALVFANSPALVTPDLGVATASGLSLVNGSSAGASPVTIAVRDTFNGTGWSLTNVHVGYDYLSDDSSGVGVGVLVRHGLRSAVTTTHSQYEWALQTAPATAGTMVDALTVSMAGVVGLPIGQLKFPAAQNPSSDPNTQDDYEEMNEAAIAQSTGIGASSGTITTASGTRSYTKVGRKVSVTWAFSISNIGTGTNNLLLVLPFTAASTGDRWAVYGTNGAVAVCGTIAEGATQAAVFKYDGTTTVVTGTFTIGAVYWTD